MDKCVEARDICLLLLINYYYLIRTVQDQCENVKYSGRRIKHFSFLVSLLIIAKFEWLLNPILFQLHSKKRIQYHANKLFIILFNEKFGGDCMYTFAKKL